MTSHEESSAEIGPGRQGSEPAAAGRTLVSVSRQTINAIEKGDYNPTIRLCIAICRALDKTLDQLFWEEEET